MTLQHWWNSAVRGKTKHSDRKLSHWTFVHNKCYKDLFLENEPQAQPGRAGRSPPEIRHKLLCPKVIWIILKIQFLPHSRYTGCPRRNVPDFGRVLLMLKYTDITQNTYVQSWTVTEIMAREKCGLLAGPRTVPVSWVLSKSVLGVWCHMTPVQLTLFM